MTPAALPVISTTFPEGAERNKALGIWGALGGIGATTAWLIGGPLTDGPGWRWIFFINVPAGLAALALSPVLLRSCSRSGPRPARSPAKPRSAAGFRLAAATGLALMAAGSLVLTQVSIHGSYFPDIFIGLLLCGLGIGLALVTATVAALAGSRPGSPRA